LVNTHSNYKKPPAPVSQKFVYQLNVLSKGCEMLMVCESHSHLKSSPLTFTSLLGASNSTGRSMWQESWFLKDFIITLLQRNRKGF